MIINLILLVLGFVILIKGADLFVDGISSTAANLKIAKIIISQSKSNANNKNSENKIPKTKIHIKIKKDAS